MSQDAEGRTVTVTLSDADAAVALTALERYVFERGIDRAMMALDPNWDATEWDARTEKIRHAREAMEPHRWRFDWLEAEAGR